MHNHRDTTQQTLVFWSKTGTQIPTFVIVANAEGIIKINEDVSI